MKMDQVAIAYRDDRMGYDIKAMLGLHHAEWICDTVKAEVTVRMPDGTYVQGENVAQLEFCTAMGNQFELIRYISGPNWIASERTFLDDNRMPFVSHIGFHLEEHEPFPTWNGVSELVQEARTVKHSNPEVNAANRRYHYRIFRVGYVYFKFIRRMAVA